MYLVFSAVVGILVGAVNIFEEHGVEIFGFLLGAVPTFFFFRNIENKSKRELHKISERKFSLPKTKADSQIEAVQDKNKVVVPMINQTPYPDKTQKHQ